MCNLIRRICDRGIRSKRVILCLSLLASVTGLVLLRTAMAAPERAASGDLLSLTWSSAANDATRAVAWGDVDGDGDLDLAVGSGSQPTRLYLNLGTSLGPSPAWSSTETGGVQAVAWGDVDGDGDLDLAAGGRLYRNDGGALTDSAVWSSGGGATSLAWGDVDGDGDLDLAVGGQPTRLFCNDGGSLTLAWSASTVYNTRSLAWVDVDVDGDLDLALGNTNYANWWYRNDTAPGGSPQLALAWMATENDRTYSLAWADFDDDGDPDFAVGNMNEPNRLYRNDGMVGGVLQTTLVWSWGGADATAAVAWGDADGDGDPDLAVGNMYDGPSYLYRNDGGTLEVDPVWSSIDTDETADLAWGDVDGDGDLDLFLGNLDQPDRVYRNDSAALETGAAWASAGFNEFGRVAWGDVENDRDLDLAATRGSEVEFYLNDGGQLQPTPTWSSGSIGTVGDVAWGDVDGDGDLDLAVGLGYDGDLGEPNLLYENMGGALSASPVYTTTEEDWTCGVAWGDIDGDGDLDLVAANWGPNRLYRNDDGILTPSGVWSSTEVDWSSRVALGDVDRDGDLDLAVGNLNQPDRLYRNEGGTFSATAVWSSAETGDTRDLAWGDVDGDGDLDLAVGSYDRRNRLYRNDDGVLSASAVWLSVEAESTQSVAWGDADGDGDLDLAVGNDYLQPPRLYRNDGGTLATGGTWSPFDVDGAAGLGWGDVDGDGDLDLVTASSSGPLRVYRNTRDGRLSPGANPLVHVTRPGPDADFYSSPNIWDGPTIPITYTLTDPQGDPVSFIRAWYSPDGGGRWLEAVAASGTLTENLGTMHAVTSTHYNTTSLPIPDPGTVTSTLPLTPTDVIADIDVFLNLTHTCDGNLAITLTAPSGRSALLVDGRGASGDDFASTTFDDEAATPIVSGTAPFSGSFRPEQTLSRFDGYVPEGTWNLSVADGVAGDTGTLLSWGMTVTLNSGAVHTYFWDVAASGVFGQLDNVAFRLQAVPAVVTGTPHAVPGPYLYGAYASQTFPFRVRGTQVRVVRGTMPVPDALVYRLPSGQASGGAPLDDGAGIPFRTDGLGYLQGRGEIWPGDRLLALAPVTVTESYTLYHTNGTPTETGLDGYTVTQAGVQTITVSADHPLLLFNLDVSLEWDAHNDPTYLQQLEFDLHKASQYLYDFTDGQVALGQVIVHQNADYWIPSHVVVQATNRLRPLAIQGGIVLTTTVDPQQPDVVYDIGQVRMGATWNRYGAPGYTPSGDWPLALAHELSHYLLFQDDVYMGLDEDGLLIPVDTCSGSAMGDMYNPDNTEFIYDEGHWAAACAGTLADRTLGRTEWETIRLWYPQLITPTILNPGPSLMPFDLTMVAVHNPVTPTQALADPTFYIDYQDGETGSSEARAFILRDGYGYLAGYDYLIDLGSPLGGQHRVLARGVQPSDRLCVFDPPLHQYGCEVVTSGDDRVALERDVTWTPVIQISPVSSRTIRIGVSALTSTLTLQARLYPEYGFGSETLPLIYESGVYSGTFALPYPVMAGHVQIWVDEGATETNPRREAIVAYAMGGNPGGDRGAWPASRGSWPASRGSWPASRGSWPASRGSWAPLVSPDGQMIFFTENPAAFEEGELYTIQSMAGLPPLPTGKVAIGQAYGLVGSPSVTRTIAGSISFQYLSMDVLLEGADEEELAIHFWDGGDWRVLDTVRAPYYNLASAPSRGDGVYALLAGTAVPQVTSVAPSAATNDVTTTLTILGSDFLLPVEVALIGPTTTFTLPLTSVGSSSITAVVTRGLPAHQYQVVAVNLDQPAGAAASPVPGVFALYDPASACFYDFFQSGLGKWQRDGSWDVVTLPGGEWALTDSPAGPYWSAGDYGSGLVTHTTFITSQSFSLDACPNPVLRFRHDYVIAAGDGHRDVGSVEISTDGGVTWNSLTGYSGGGVFGDRQLGTAQGAASSEWADVDWQDVAVDLSSYSGTVRLRFGLEVDGAVSDKGWIVDDVRVQSGHRVFLPLILRSD
jgi:subtilisin-like proprotein convertase family protein